MGPYLKTQRQETGWGKGRRKREEMERERGTEKARDNESKGEQRKQENKREDVCIEIQIGSRNTGCSCFNIKVPTRKG